MSRPHLTVVTHQRWRAEDLSPYARVRLDLGLDTSAASDHDTAFWCPGAWAAAATVRHPHVRLSSAGTRWLDRVYRSLSGRDIRTAAAAELLRTATGERGDPVFAKLPETKHDSFTARVRDVGELLGELCRLPADELVQVQEPVHFEHEVRCWILDGQVVARAAYFPDAQREQWSALDDPGHSADAVAWLAHLIPHYLAVPAAVVIDVGWCTDPADGAPGWRVVEANAPWSADWYTPTDMDAVVETIIASRREVPDEWRWQPSPLLKRLSVGLTAR
ncbi:Uncharacterised protein [Mycobacteroides abscessus subsp. massiliense]|uniref:ATP-grasp domain-containing protein n=1 Tax=Mycobacteroides abscessus TaxID=36809 RepID=UPI0009A5BC3B|nr:ATP-grasp domain-containing protein [Mycobacteroides abscessus]SKT54485.1 Uncharacterised protein [Mycobacteroides abscessus subsp. massiliense]